MPNLKGEAVLPEGVIEIRSRAFYRRKGLTSVTIPASIQVIHREAFALCKDLRTVHFLGAPREIARSAFHKCPAGNHLYLPKGSQFHSDFGTRALLQVPQL